jgi:hypothetical protein
VFPGSKNGDSSKSFVDMVFEYGRFGRELAGLEKQYYGSSTGTEAHKKSNSSGIFPFPWANHSIPWACENPFFSKSTALASI